VCATPIIVKEDSYKFLKLYRQFVRKLHKLSLFATVGGLAFSGWLVSSCYGLWALKTFMGDEILKSLLLQQQQRGSESRKWKWLPSSSLKLWLNLPLIPFALILSRTPLIDSLLPFLPLTLALSSSTTSHSYSHSHSHFQSDPLGLSDLNFHYPPSPTLTICLIPWLRILYFRTRSKIFKKVLGPLGGEGKTLKGLAGMMEQAAREEQATWEVLGGDQDDHDQDEDEANGDDETNRRHRRRRGDGGGNGGRMRNGIELVAELEYEYEEEEEEEEEEAHPLDGEQSQQQQQPPRHQQRQTIETPPTTPTRRDPPSSLRIGIGRLTSLLIGALIYPALSSLVGSALFYLATRGGGGSRKNPSLGIKTLRKILGISTSLIASSSYKSQPSSSSSSSIFSSILSFLNPFGGGGGNTHRFGYSSNNGVVVDPVWIRNTLGGGIVLLVRDSFELIVGVLELKRKNSRRIQERPVGESLSLQQQQEQEETTTLH
jgi:hypothetical protein